MTFQSIVRIDAGYGVIGESVFDGPRRANVGVVVSSDATTNVFGRAFTYTSAAEGSPIQAGGTGIFAGVLSCPKEHVSVGTSAGGTLAATLALPNNTPASFSVMDEILMQTGTDQAAAPKVGDILQYNTTTGEIVTVAPGTTPATGYANVPNGVVARLPQQYAVTANFSGWPFIGRLTN